MKKREVLISREEVPNEDIMVLHLDIGLLKWPFNQYADYMSMINSEIEMFGSPCDWPSYFILLKSKELGVAGRYLIWKLTHLRGVVGVFLQKYEVTIEFGKHFSVSKNQPEVERIIQKAFAIEAVVMPCVAFFKYLGSVACSFFQRISAVKCLWAKK